MCVHGFCVVFSHGLAVYFVTSYNLVPFIKHWEVVRLFLSLGSWQMATKWILYIQNYKYRRLKTWNHILSLPSYFFLIFRTPTVNSKCWNARWCMLNYYTCQSSETRLTISKLFSNKNSWRTKKKLVPINQETQNQ